ncbi:MAG: hypothetical protein L0Y36_08230 [Planctomycetales bacterium]|nr:hypothetical protein [Planctomycetales bacterium]
MKLPHVKEAAKYIGLYAVDFGDHGGVGFTAEEVAELLESERFGDVKVYRIYRAGPDGTMELKGIRRETFQLEAGMFFYAADEAAAQADFERLLGWADAQAAPARAKVHLACQGERYVTALIYPAEYDDAFSRWLLDGSYRTVGQAEGGPEAVGRYYQAGWDILEQKQLWPASSMERLQGEALLEATKRAVVR